MLQSCYEKSSLNLKDRSTLLVEIKMIKLNVEAYLHPNIYHAWQNASILPYLYRASDLGIEIVLFLSVCLSIIFFPSFSLVGLWCRTRFLWVKTELCRLNRFFFNCIFINHSTNQDDLWSACYFLSLKKKKKKGEITNTEIQNPEVHIRRLFFFPFISNWLECFHLAHSHYYQQITMFYISYANRPRRQGFWLRGAKCHCHVRDRKCTHINIADQSKARVASRALMHATGKPYPTCKKQTKTGYLLHPLQMFLTLAD